MSTELVVRPGRIDDGGFTDLAPHRQPLPSVYNRYSFTRLGAHLLARSRTTADVVVAAVHNLVLDRRLPR